MLVDELPQRRQLVGVVSVELRQQRRDAGWRGSVRDPVGDSASCADKVREAAEIERNRLARFVFAPRLPELRRRG